MSKYNLYGLRDRLINYYCKPFMTSSDADAMAAVAFIINNGESNEPLSLTPEHFELWRLGEIDQQTGQIAPQREFLCDAASLLRPSVRGGPDAGATPIQPSQGGRRGQAPTAPQGAGTVERAPQGASQAENREGAKGAPGSRGTA